MLMLRNFMTSSGTFSLLDGNNNGKTSSAKRNASSQITHYGALSFVLLVPHAFYVILFISIRNQSMFPSLSFILSFLFTIYYSEYLVRMKQANNMSGNSVSNTRYFGIIGFRGVLIPYDSRTCYIFIICFILY